MDSLYCAGFDLIDVAEFLKSFQDKVALLETDMKRFAENTCPEELETLEANVDLDRIAHPADVKVESVDLLNAHPAWGLRHSISVPRDALALNCVRERIDRWSVDQNVSVVNKFKSCRFVQPKSAAEGQPQNPTRDIKPLSEVLICIRILIPFKYNPYKKKLAMKFDKEIHFLGSQYLHELRDLITCKCDTKGPFLDISENPNADLRSNDRYADQTNSGFLFIGDTFYNDMRNEENIDYSKEIVEWAKKQKDMKELHSVDMAETRFLDLKRIAVGSACLYKHFGECEHLFLISDMRVITEADHLIRSDYPFLYTVGRPRNCVCDMCGIYEVNYLVKDSAQHIFDPVRLCAKCLNSYHYVDGKKQGQFTVYRF